MLGIKLPTALGQGQLVFAETYTRAELLSMLESTDPLFTWIETDQSDSEGARIGSCASKNQEKLLDYLESQQFLDQVPEDLKLVPGAGSPGGEFFLYAIRKQPGPYTGPDEKDIEKVHIQVDPETRSSDLLITFTRKGATKWADLTRNNIGRNLAILVDDRVYGAPRVMMEIKEGKCRISGDFSETQIQQLSEILQPRKR